MDKEFRFIFENHYNNLCRAAYRILLDEDSAREVVQEVFIELWKTDNWRQLQSPKAYLYVAVYNKSISELRKRKRFVSEEAIPELSIPHVQKLEEEELERIIFEGIESLPEQCKRVFVLSREEEFSYKEIADQLGLSVKTVERHMGIALKKLRDYLQKYWSG